MTTIEEKTISDFGEQWQEFQDNSGYYSSLKLFRDIVGPLLNTDDLSDKTVADVGSGTGRLVNMLAEAGAGHIVAIEPSSSFEILKRNTAKHHNRISYFNICGHELNFENHFDYIFSIGVLHHILNPFPCLRACYRSLKKGGRIIIWLYGSEGNTAYLLGYRSLCRITKLMRHSTLMCFCRLIYPLIMLYGKLTKQIRLPLRAYFINHYLLLDHHAQLLTLYDQLNPAYTKYYKKTEAVQLLKTIGFQDVGIYRRHGYSWTVIGTRP